MDILEMLTNAGVTIPEENKAEFDKTFRKEFKHIAEIATNNGKYDAEIKGLNEQLDTANNKIQEFTSMDIDGIKKAADEYKAAAEQAKVNADKRIAELEFDGVLKEHLMPFKFSSDYARAGVMQEIKTKGLPLDNGKITGFDDVIKSIKEAQPTAFVDETAPPPPMYAGAGKTPINKNMTKEEFSKLGYSERLKLKGENLALYEQLSKKGYD